MNYFRSLIFAVLTLVVAVGLNSCSGSDGEKVTRFASSDDVAVVHIDLDRIFKEFKFTRDKSGTVELPSELSGLTALMPREQRTIFNRILENPYLVYDDAAIIVGKEAEGAIMAFSIKNADDFMKQMADDYDLDIEHRDDWALAELDSKSYLLAKDRTALVVAGKDLDETPVKFVTKAEQRAQDKPLAGEYIEYLNKADHTISVYANVPGDQLPAKLRVDKDFITLFSLAMKGKKWTLDMLVYDEDGKPMKTPFQAKVDKSMLKYADKSHNAAYLIGDLNNVLDNFRDMKQARPETEIFFSSFEGPAMVSGSLNARVFTTGGENGLSLTFAATCKPGKAASVIDFLAKQEEKDFAVSRYEPGKSVTFSIIQKKSSQKYDSLPETYGKNEEGYEYTVTEVIKNELSIKADGDVIVACLNATPGGNVLKNMDIPTDATVAMLVDLDRHSSLLELAALTFGIKSTCFITKDSEGTWDVTVTDTDKSLAECLLTLAKTAAK